MFTPLRQLAAIFLKLGLIGFGGPAAHIAMLEDEIVARRKWLSREEFLDLLGATHLIPGPNSTELVMHVGFRRAGVPGLLVAGACFITPAVFLTTLFAWLYVSYGHRPGWQGALEGIKPAVLAVIAAAGVRLAKTACRTPRRAAIAVVAAAACLLGGDEVWVLIGLGACGALLLGRQDPGDEEDRRSVRRAPEPARPGLMLVPLVPSLLAAAARPVTLWTLALFFLKIGAVLYGSGYVLLAYLRGGIEMGGPLHGQLTETELLDAIAIGQFTPGPLLSTSAFVGYIVRGPLGALVAAAAIFAPSFLFVALSSRLIPKLRSLPWTARVLDAVVAASLGLLAAVVLSMAAATMYDPVQHEVHWPRVAIALVALLAVIRWKVSAAWIVLGGGAAGAVL